MAVMAKPVKAAFIVAEDKIEAFKKWSDQPKGERDIDKALARASRYMKVPTYRMVEVHEGSRHEQY
ncbi:MAG: hypothetical protein IJS96_00510 [Schwartzia sp.]|nr:hypothetical protein [Schwartzia sp. (in: firmicutes)]